MYDQESDNRNILFIVAIAIVAVIVSCLLVLVGNLTSALIGILAVVVSSVFYRYPRVGLWLFIFYMPFAGTVTYSLDSIYQTIGGYVSYSSNYALLHLAKDAFYFPALIAVAISTGFWQKLRPKIRPFIITVLLLTLSALLTIFLVNLGSGIPGEKPLLMGIMGLKILIGYIPLSLCAYWLMGDQKTLWWWLRIQAVVAIVCCVLTGIQYLLLLNGVCPGNVGLESPANSSTTLQARCFVGGSLLYNPYRNLLRLPGTFVAPWQWGWFLISSSFFAYGLSRNDPQKHWRVVGWVAIALIFMAAIISGQRIALLLVPTVLLILALTVEKPSKKQLITIASLIAAVAIAIVFIPIVQQQWISLVDRWQYSPPHEFVGRQFNWILEDKLSLLGEGLGRATSAARRLGKIRLIETFYARLLYEIGILGTLAFLAVITSLVVLTFRGYRQIKSASMRRLAFTLWLFLFIVGYNTYYYPLAVDPVAVYYWWVAGVLLRLPELETKPLAETSETSI